MNSPLERHEVRLRGLHGGVQPPRRAVSRERVRRGMTVAAVAVPLVLAAGALVVDGWEARRFLLLYVAPFFVAFFAWARIRVDALERTGRRAMSVDALAVVLGAARFAGLPVPFSGHMLFFAYSALGTRSALYRLLVLVLAAETTWFKLVLWRDPASWGLGIAAGVLLATVRIVLDRSNRPLSVP